jgi:serine/threonine-protein kinase HipA
MNERALIVTRFDRTTAGEKLRLEDFAQILCKPRGRDYAGKYNASYEELADGLKAYSSRPIIDLARFFRRLVVYALVGNCDAHLKNFSLLETSTGLRLSPVYDVVNSAMYEGYDQNFALEINGQKIAVDRITRSILEGFGLSIGVPKAEIDLVFSRLTASVKAAQLLITPSAGEPPDGFMHRFNEVVSRSCLNILGK